MIGGHRDSADRPVAQEVHVLPTPAQRCARTARAAVPKRSDAVTTGHKSPNRIELDWAFSWPKPVPHGRLRDLNPANAGVRTRVSRNYAEFGRVATGDIGYPVGHLWVFCGCSTPRIYPPGLVAGALLRSQFNMQRRYKLKHKRKRLGSLARRRPCAAL